MSIRNLWCWVLQEHLWCSSRKIRSFYILFNMSLTIMANYNIQNLISLGGNDKNLELHYVTSCSSFAEARIRISMEGDNFLAFCRATPLQMQRFQELGILLSYELLKLLYNAYIIKLFVTICLSISFFNILLQWFEPWWYWF